MLRGMIFMAAGLAFWLLMNNAINARLFRLALDMAGLVAVITVAVAIYPGWRGDPQSNFTWMATGKRFIPA